MVITSSFVMSILTVFISTAKFCVSLWRRFKNDEPWHDFKPSAELLMCFLLIAPTVPLLIFSIKRNETLVQVFLSVAARLLIIYQCGILWIFCVHYPQRLRWLGLRLQLSCAVLTIMLSVLIAQNKGQIEAEKITTLSSFAAEHALLTVVYVKVWRYHQDSNLQNTRLLLRPILRQSLVLSVIASACAIVSLALYARNRKDFVISLWIVNAANSIWSTLWLVEQSASIIKSKCNSNAPEPPKSSWSQRDLCDFQNSSLYKRDASQVLAAGSNATLSTTSQGINESATLNFSHHAPVLLKTKLQPPQKPQQRRKSTTGQMQELESQEGIGISVHKGERTSKNEGAHQTSIKTDGEAIQRCKKSLIPLPKERKERIRKLKKVRGGAGAGEVERECDFVAEPVITIPTAASLPLQYHSKDLDLLNSSQLDPHDPSPKYSQAYFTLNAEICPQVEEYHSPRRSSKSIRVQKRHRRIRPYRARETSKDIEADDATRNAFRFVDFERLL